MAVLGSDYQVVHGVWQCWVPITRLSTVCGSAGFRLPGCPQCVAVLGSDYQVVHGVWQCWVLITRLSTVCGSAGF